MGWYRGAGIFLFLEDPQEEGIEVNAPVRRYGADILTFGNLISGCLSLGFLLRGAVEASALLILLAVFLDGFDGYVARKFGSAGEFGKNLDSFADLISFGVAPACLVFSYDQVPWPCTANRDRNLVMAIVCISYVVCSAWRLARYNVGKSNGAGRSFLGLPTTMSGGALGSVGLLFTRKGWDAAPVLFMCLVAGMSLLMISRIPYPNLRGIRRLFGERKILISCLWAGLFAVTLLMGTEGAAAGVFFTGLFMVYVLFFPLLKKNFV